ncbi:MAG TPA: toxic anion resistance protein [Candidatus Dormibacteraeota bacterium]|nr:toxic anion resistance protein [Candidatus Dormibacteraeota bacterium]
MSDQTAANSGVGSEMALALVAPQPVPQVTDQQAMAQAQQVDPAAAKQIQATVNSYVDQLVALDPHSPDFDSKVEAIHSLGDADIRASAAVSNRLLQEPAKAMNSGPLSKTSEVSNSLVKLRRTVEDLDPQRQGVLSKKTLFGIIPFGNKLRDYFAKYESSQRNIDAVMQSLYRGQDELRQDNAALEQEKTNVWAIKDKLQQYLYMSAQLDSSLTSKIASLHTADPDRAKALQEDVLFYVRQKRQDLLTQLAVNMQGYLAMDLIRKSNLELIKGVDRATTTTVSALRTAVIVAQALNNQKLVLDQIDALNTTTSNLIESTSELLKQQTRKVYDQAASSTINLQQLQTAFNNIYQTMDSIDAFKLQALDSMKQTIDGLTTEVGKAQTYLDRARTSAENEAQAGADLVIPTASS